MTKVKRIIVLGVLVLCAAVGVAVPAFSQAIPPPRYQVISDMLDLQQRIEALERDNAELREDMRIARDQIGALQLLRASRKRPFIRCELVSAGVAGRNRRQIKWQCNFQQTRETQN